MDGTVFVVVLVIVVVLVAAVALVARRRPTTPREPGPTPGSTASARRRPAVEGPFLGPLATIRLDVVASDPEAASVQRLVRAATAKVFRTSPDVDEVIVEDRDGTVVARVPRQPPDPGPPPTRAEGEAHQPRAHGSWHEPEFVPSVDQDAAVGRRALAERLDLPEDVRARVRHPDDAVDLVRAILEAAGRDVDVQGSMVRSGPDVVIVAEDASGGAGAALSQAFLRFRESGARQGIVIHLGYVDPREVARRRALSPQVHHAGTEVLQQMADAVALGGDPVQFALADVVG